MKKLSVFGIIGGAALLAAAPVSLQWSQKTVTLSIDSADARIGRPLTPLSVAGVQRRSYRRAVRSISLRRRCAVLLVTALARTTAATAIRRIPHRPHRLTGLATAMGRITAAVAIHPPAMLATAILLQAMLATAILLLAMLATAILLMATAAPTPRAIASPAGWRSIEPAGAEARAYKVVPPRRCGSPAPLGFLVRASHLFKSVFHARAHARTARAPVQARTHKSRPPAFSLT